MSQEQNGNQESKGSILEKINNYAGVASGAGSAAAGIATSDPFLAIGGAVAFFSSFITPFMKRNGDKFLNDLKVDFENLEKQVGLKITEALSNEKVLSAILEAYPTAIREYREEKMTLLRNAILNIALEIDLTNDLRSIYLRFIDELTPTHILILLYFKDPKDWLSKKKIPIGGITMTGAITFLEKAFPELGDYLDQFVRDLISRGLLPNGEWLRATTSSFLEPRTNKSGLDFLRFIESPLV